jgi:hypothetical protein
MAPVEHDHGRGRVKAVRHLIDSLSVADRRQGRCHHGLDRLVEDLGMVQAALEKQTVAH